jgi:hypothetical protein
VPRRDHIRPPRSPAAVWSARILGLLGAAVVLAVGAVVVSMVLPGSDDKDASSAATPTATPTTAPPKAKRGLTARQRAQRRRAVAELRRQGYAPVKLADYRADHVLRVLIGAPADGAAPGRRAFFFVRGRYVGHDAETPSRRMRPGRQLEREITLVYTVYPGEHVTRVHFRWTGEALEPREQIPPAFERMPPGFAQ